MKIIVGIFVACATAGALALVTIFGVIALKTWEDKK